VPEDIGDPAAADIFYCSFTQFMQPGFAVPLATIVLVDEFHELFFNTPLAVVNGKLISVVQQLTLAEKIIGVSATFRGDAGVKKIKNILSDTLFLSAPEEFKEKDLQLQVFGELMKDDIVGKALSLAEKEAGRQPVVFFCSSEM